ncbi:MAG: helix-turn-helix domain-containing protein [Candidatus Nezhaarchaeota archaeon]|nr:helix-turn-helix domain-containing protein [Candidatus Nezhaarchaeota archaeon]
MSRPDLFDEVAKHLPSEQRRELVKRLFEINEYSITKTARQANISRAQLYRYLGLSERQNIPSDSVTARILKALYLKQPSETAHLLQQTANKFLELIGSLKTHQTKTTSK